MSKEKLEAQFDEKAGNSSVEESMTQQETKPPVFYRCVCPECGGDDLELCRFGDVVRSRPACIDDEGEIGCYEVELDADCFDYHLECQDCGHTLSGGWSDFADPLLEKARSKDDRLETMRFVCPSCESHTLYQFYAEAKIFHEVVAIYTTTEEDESEPVVAISPHIAICPHGPVRYECSHGHVLLKDDATPVVTDEELVEWLEAHQPTTKA